MLSNSNGSIRRISTDELARQGVLEANAEKGIYAGQGVRESIELTLNALKRQAQQTPNSTIVIPRAELPFPKENSAWEALLQVAAEEIQMTQQHDACHMVEFRFSLQ